MERRWDEVEDTLRGFDQTALKEEIVALAYRLDDIKSDLGNANNSPAIRALEDKLITMAGFVEQLGRRIQPNENVLTEHFSGVDQRLDEISRAIAATSNRAQHSPDAALLERLENRLNGLSGQLDQLKDMSAEKDKPSDALTGRLDALQTASRSCHQIATSRSLPSNSTNSPPIWSNPSARRRSLN